MAADRPGASAASNAISAASDLSDCSAVTSDRSTSTNAVLTPGSGQARLKKFCGRYMLSEQDGLRNSLHNGVGYLELANAGDFAANVFNQIPVPVYAIPLMAIGGAVGIVLPYVAIVDARRSWRNLQMLRAERRRLTAARANGADMEKSAENILETSIMLDMNFKEMGVELVDRLIMDGLMGVGALIVGVGTLMAIGGANPAIYSASNLLSGYVGNSFAAMYGFIDTAWAGFVWLRAHRHQQSSRRKLPTDSVGQLLRSRIRAVQLHAIVHGMTCMAAGVASLLTATRWWGYVILVPCVVTSIWSNYFFKRRLGYNRPIFTTGMPIDEDAICRELAVDHGRSKAGTAARSSFLDKLGNDGQLLDSLPAALDYVVTHDLFEDFALALARKHPTLFMAVARPEQSILLLRAEDILNAAEPHAMPLLAATRNCIESNGPLQQVYRQRYLLELLGNSLHYKARHSVAACS